MGPSVRSSLHFSTSSPASTGKWISLPVPSRIQTGLGTSINVSRPSWISYSLINQSLKSAIQRSTGQEFSLSFAHLLWEDEWGYYVAFSGPEKAVVSRVSSYPNTTPPSDALLFRDLVRNSEAYLIQVEYGHWHVFSRHGRWLELLRGYHPTSVEVSSNVYSRA